MAAEDPALWEAALVAQELQRRVQAGEFKLAEVMGWPPSAAGDGSGNVQRLAAELGWTPELLAQGQGLLQEAVQKAALERGVGTLSSFATGMPVSVYPPGERRQIELQQQARGQMYSPLEAAGAGLAGAGAPADGRQAERGRSALQAFQAAHPEMLARSAAGSLIEPEEYTGMTPEELRMMEVGRRYRLDEQFMRDVAVNTAIREQPWNTARAREAAQAEYQRPLTTDDGRQTTGEGQTTPEPAVRLWSTYGANPQEAAQIRREQLLSTVSAAMPHLDDFRGADGEADYEAYDAAVTGFFGKLAREMGSDPTVAAIAQDRGVGVEELVQGLTREDVQAYWNRSDTPLEALQRVWDTEVYGGAWERYSAAVTRLTGQTGGALPDGEAKSQAWDEAMEAPGVAASDLIEQVMAEYPDRWTREELARTFEGVAFPSPADVSFLRKAPAEQEQIEAQDAFWQFYNEELPPGKLAAEARAIPLVQTLLDAETRGMATAEQYLAAQEKLALFKAREFDPEVWGTPSEWAQARAENERFTDLRERTFPDVMELQSRYFELEQEERRAFLVEHAGLKEYWDFREWYGGEYPVWGRFYLGTLTPGPSPTGGEGSGGGAGAGVGAEEGGFRREWHTAEFVALAQEQNGQFREAAEAAFAEYGGLDGMYQMQSGYYEVPTQWREAYLRAFPELQAYWDFRKGYAEAFPVWGYWYVGPGKYLRDQYWPQRGKGGGHGRAWRRGYPGKWTLDAPNPWEGALRLPQETGREGMPWVMDKPGYRQQRSPSSWWLPRVERR